MFAHVRCLTALKLLIDKKCLLVQLVLLADGDLGNIGTVVVLQALDVVHDAHLIGLDGGEDEQILQVSVGCELAVLGSVQNDALEQLDELVGQVGGHEGLDGRRNLLGDARLRQSRRDNLVDQLAAVGQVGLVLHKNAGPQIQVLTLNKVASLILKQKKKKHNMQRQQG